MNWVVLQACTTKEWAEGKWKHCLFDPVINLIGIEAFAVLMGPPVLFALYIAGDGDLATPTVVMFLLTGIMFSLLPPSLQGIAYTTMFLGVVSGLLEIARRYIMPTGGVEV